ncbi:MAG: DotU family type IV/VI secretion system protein, partial [Planctomycetia bacterium]
MRQELSDLVFPVFQAGLRLRRRLVAGETVDIDVEQAALRTLLFTDAEARRVEDFGGGGDLSAGPASLPGAAAAGRPAPFLGVRYALVCWLDELFILHSPWGREWNERKLEVALYGSNDRAWKFWDQSARAESRPTLDALETFFLCVMLGFGGALGEEADRLSAWVAAARDRIGRASTRAW